MITDVKEKIVKIVESQPDDSSFDEILRELVFSQMIDRGLEEIQAGEFITEDELLEDVDSWYK